MAANMLFWAAIIASFIFLLVWLVRRAGTGLAAVNPNPGPLSAREIAQMRYARGEIGRDEYLKLTEDLG